MPHTPESRAKVLVALAAGREKYRLEQEALREAKIGRGLFECYSCHKALPLSEFPSGRSRRDGSKRYGYCKQCHSAYQRVLILKRLFNLTPDDYETLLRAQGGVCYICRQPPKSRRLAVDHDHHTGLIRGLLCSFCNRAISVFRDNEERLQRAVDYLKNPPATAALGAPRYGLKGRTTNKAATRDRLNRNRLFPGPEGKIQGTGPI